LDDSLAEEVISKLKPEAGRRHGQPEPREEYPRLRKQHKFWHGTVGAGRWLEWLRPVTDSRGRPAEKPGGRGKRQFM
jgi:hypothetical protein